MSTNQPEQHSRVCTTMSMEDHSAAMASTKPEDNEDNVQAKAAALRKEVAAEEEVRKVELQHLLHVEFNLMLSQLEELFTLVTRCCSPRQSQPQSDAPIRPRSPDSNVRDIQQTSLVRDLQLNHKTSAVASGSASGSSEAPSRWEASSPQSWMDLSMHLDGYLIPHAQISVKLQKFLATTKKHGTALPLHTVNSYGVFVTQIRQPRYPLVLHQLLQIHGIVSAELHRLQNWDKHDTEIEASSAYDFTVETAASLRNCINILCSPSNEIFPMCLLNGDQQIQFQPPLPKDMIIQVSVLRDELVVAGYGIRDVEEPTKQRSTAPRKEVYSQQNICFIDLAGKVFTFDERSVEVVDQVLVKFSVHSLGIILDTLCNAQQLTLSMKRKLDAHVELETIFKNRSGSSRGVVNEKMHGHVEEAQDISDWMF